MQTWVFVSEIVRNLGLALSALGSVVLAWWKLTPAPMQVGAAERFAPPLIDLRGAFIRYTDFSNAILRDGDLSNADLTGAKLRNSDFAGTRLNGAFLDGADLTGARNLTIAQLASAIIDEHTRLPAYIDRAKVLEDRAPS